MRKPGFGIEVRVECARKSILDRSGHSLRSAEAVRSAGDDSCGIRPKRLEESMNVLIDIQRLVPAWESLESAWVRAETLVGTATLPCTGKLKVRSLR